jgi:hypothetical protein
MALPIERGIFKGWWYFGQEHRKLRRYRWVSAWLSLVESIIFILSFSRITPDWSTDRLAELITKKYIWKRLRNE